MGANARVSARAHTKSSTFCNENAMFRVIVEIGMSKAFKIILCSYFFFSLTHSSAEFHLYIYVFIDF